MDFLSSIMNSMDKPPSKSVEERNLLKKQKEAQTKLLNDQKANFEKFKSKTEKKLIEFIKDDTKTNIAFEPCNKMYRSVIHEVADSLSLLSYAFGIDELDRYVRVYKREHPPCEDELTVRKNGEDWNDETKNKLNERRKKEQEYSLTRVKEKDIKPNSNYKDKYAHLIGKDAALQAARKTETNATYGFVPSENKKDLRSIEQTMADIQARKRMKLNNESETKASDETTNK